MARLRTIDIVKMRHQEQEVLPVSYQQDMSGEQALSFGYLCQFRGRVEDICVDVIGKPGPGTQLMMEVERVRRNSREARSVQMISGRNNLGSFDVEAGDRITFRAPAQAEVSSAWISFTYVY